MDEVTNAQIAAWKKKHSDLYEISIEGKKAYFRSPDRNTMSYMISQGQQNPMAATEILAKNCFVGGDKALLDEDKYFFAVMQQLGKLMQVKDASLKKL